MKVAITGSSGLIGSALVESLRGDGHEVLRLVRRSPRAPDETQWDPGSPLDPAALAGVDAAVNLAGAGVGDKRWTESYKRTLIDSRLHSTHTLATAFAGLEPRPAALISASGVDYYGDTGDREIDETAPPGTGFLAELCVRWEAATAPAEAAGIRVAHLRTTLVVAEQGGAFGRMFTLFRLGLGGRLGSGRQYWGFISLTDHVRAIRYLLAHEVSGPVNMCAPEPVTNAEVTKAIGSVLHRPTLLPAPGFGLRLVLGEFAEAPLASHRVRPAVLVKAGYEHRHPTIESALRAAL